MKAWVTAAVTLRKMFNDISCQIFFNVRMAGNLFNYSGLWILVNIMLSSVPDKNGSPLANFF
jgi:hypothetical protein